MASIWSGKEDLNPLNRGRRLYQQKDYYSACRAFSEAIEISAGLPLYLALDHRAATFEKLDQLQDALRDSKRMIGLKPDLAKGYLRCGKILHAKGEREVAVKIYQRGLNKVKIGIDNDRLLLQRMFDKLGRDPNIRIDPLASLPNELVEMVLQKLEIRDRITCLSVSKLWKRRLESSHALWTTFDTRCARNAVSMYTLKVYLRRSRYKLSKAVITRDAYFKRDNMQYLTQTCKQLQHLEIHGVDIVYYSMASPILKADQLTTIHIGKDTSIPAKFMLRTLQVYNKTLVEARFLSVQGKSNPSESWPTLESLEHFDLHIHEKEARFFDLKIVVGSMPNVKHLTLVDCDNEHDMGRLDLSSCKHLEFLHFGSEKSPYVPILPPTVKHLEMSDNLNFSGSHPEATTFDLPALESFDCSDTALGNPLLLAITARSIKAGRLKKLLIGRRFTDYPFLAVKDEYPASDTVTVLHLATVEMTEDRILEIVDLYPNLRSLDVSQTKITGVAVKHFVSRGITTLRCNGCYEISPDAIAYARDAGVEIEAQINPRRRLAMNKIFSIGPS